MVAKPARLGAIRRGAQSLGAVLLLLAGGCTKRNPRVCCETEAECASVGYDEPAPCDLGACVANSCVEVGCDGDEDCGNSTTCIAGSCRTTAEHCALLGGARVLFDSDITGDEEIYIAYGDGSSPRALTTRPGLDISPRPEPTGTRMAFIRGGATSRDVFVMGIDGAEPVNLSNSTDLDEQTVWAPSGGWLAITANAGTSAFLIATTGVARLDLRGAAGSQTSSPSWSPNSSRVVFASNSSAGSGLWTVQIDGSNAVEIVTGIGMTFSNPRWSPDGSKIAYLAEVSGATDIWTSDPDGMNSRNLTQSSAKEVDLEWSSDGAAIAFVREQGALRDIWTMRQDGGSSKNLTFDDGINERPRWSPDGASLLYEHSGDGKRGLRRVSKDGGDSVALTPDVANSAHGEWTACSP